MPTEGKYLPCLAARWYQNETQNTGPLTSGQGASGHSSTKAQVLQTSKQEGNSPALATAKSPTRQQLQGPELRSPPWSTPRGGNTGNKDHRFQIHLSFSSIVLPNDDMHLCTLSSLRMEITKLSPASSGVCFSTLVSLILT